MGRQNLPCHCTLVSRMYECDLTLYQQQILELSRFKGFGDEKSGLFFLLLQRGSSISSQLLLENFLKIGDKFRNLKHIDYH